MKFTFQLIYSAGGGEATKTVPVRYNLYSRSIISNLSSQAEVDRFCNLRVVEKPTVAQLVKKFTAFCGTRMFITVFTRARCLLLS